MENMEIDALERWKEMNFYYGKKVLITGHTGFKGSWMCCVLLDMGARVTGYSLPPSTSPSLFELSGIEKEIHSVMGDVRNLEHLRQVFDVVRPEIVIHMAAQPIVRESYKNPVYTYDVNVMGTVNVLECVRQSDSVRSFLNVTTDKVYKNNEWIWGYREDEELNGYDPYSNSKSCSELVTDSYKKCFFSDNRTAISTARAGNVIGGGDFASDRIIPDCLRAIKKGENIVIRNPYSIRPYQHVLESIFAYLMIASRQYKDIKFSGNYNVGPDENSCVTTEKLVETFCDEWKALTGYELQWCKKEECGPHEANFLRLDCSKIKSVFGWKPVWDYRIAVWKTVEWMNTYVKKGNIASTVMQQIQDYSNSLQGM